MGSRLEKGSAKVRKRIESHNFDDEEGEEYEGSAFGGFSDYFRRKKIKLQNLDAQLRSHSTDKPQIFRGIVAHVNGYTQPSLNDLHKLIVQYGGGFMQYLDGKTTVTHIIASSLTPKKAVEFKRYRIVKPAWVVESIKAGKLLPWDSFRVLDEGAGQSVIAFSNGKVINEASTQTRGYKDQTDNSWYTKQLRDTPHDRHGSFLSQIPEPDQADELDDIEDVPPPSTQLPPRSASAIQSEKSHDELVESQRNLPEVRQFKSKEENNEDSVPQTESPNAADFEVSNHDLMDLNFPVEEHEGPLRDSKSHGMLLALTENMKGEEINVGDDSQALKRAIDHSQTDPSKQRKLTAEEHNEILLSDPRIWKSSVVNPDFLEQYYRESRLHHLSTWKADLKSQMQALTEEKTATQKARQKRPASARRYVMHVDFDSFFAAVSLKKHPLYKDKPAVVAHGTGTGSEIASCNYPARKYGITNGMWMKRAHELCSDLKILPYDFPAYEEASRSFYEAILATGALVQSVSVDEALVDISALCYAAVGGDGVKRHEGTVYREQAAADDIAQKLRDEVKQKTGCDVSIGIGGNILLAKLALRRAKPAGQHQIRPEEVLDFIGPLNVTSLPGVAYSLGGKLEEMGIKLVKDIRECSKEKLTSILGPKTGEKLWDYARGIDKKEVGDVEIRKSVSAEVNWGVRFYNQDQVDEFIGNLCGELTRRLIKERVKGKQLALKIMRRSADAPLDPPKHLGHGKCDSYNKSVLLGVATNSQEVLAKETLSLLKAWNFSPGELRGIGVQMTRLESLKPISAQEEGSQRRLQFKVAEPTTMNRKPIEHRDDPIEDFVTPKKTKAPPDRTLFGAEELNKGSPSRKPLNTLGTQFLLPSQVDPSVLAELPQDIRDKLVQHIRGDSKTGHQGREKQQVQKAPPRPFTALPRESQLDPEILKSLPADVRAEVMSFYAKSPLKPNIGEQAILPQSPKKTRTAPAPRVTSAAIKRRGRPSRADIRSDASNSTLTQSNFIAGKVGFHDTATDDEQSAEPSETEPDPEFLAALPEDIRREVLEEHRRKKLAKISGLQFSARRKVLQPQRQTGHVRIERTVRLLPRPPKPTFTSRKLSTLPALRDAISEWGREFREEGPYKEDVDALGAYLAKVVTEEANMAKAVTAIKWLKWVVEEELVEDDDAKDKWEKALDCVMDFVKRATVDRGLGDLKF